MMGGDTIAIPMTNSPSVAILGEALIDFKATGPLAFQGFVGGSSLNVAVAVARQQQPVVFLTQISRDLLGAPIKRYLIDNGVDTRYLLESDAPSTVAFVEERDGNAHFQFMNSGAADTQYDPSPRPGLPDSVRFVQFGSISLLNEPTATSIADIVAAHRARVITVFDPNCRPALTKDRAVYRAALLGKWIPLAHILKISDQDLAWLEPGRDHAEAAQAWLGLGPSVVIVTAGEKGATLYRQTGAPIHVSPPAIRVLDTVGAGDTFTANTMVRLLQLGVQSANALASLGDAQWRDVMTYAAKAAAINCTRAGANPPTLAEMVE